jgi:hypothetical protein
MSVDDAKSLYDSAYTHYRAAGANETCLLNANFMDEIHIYYILCLPTSLWTLSLNIK